jgi:hypothetical protein
MRWARHVTDMENTVNIYHILMRKGSLLRPGHTLEDDIRKSLKEAASEGVE